MNDDQRMEKYRRDSIGSARMLVNCLLGSIIFWLVVIIAFASCESHGAVVLGLPVKTTLHNAGGTIAAQTYVRPVKSTWSPSNSGTVALPENAILGSVPTGENVRVTGALSGLLLALAQIETGNNPRAIGRAGERSEYQITPAVWRGAAQRLRREASTSNPSVSPGTLIAAYHLGVIQQSLSMHFRRKPTSQEIYQAWNAGIGSVIRKRVPSSSRRSSERFANLVALYSK
jgi:hypothetical protein